MRLPWDSFLERYLPLARNLAAGVSGRPSEAEDLVQEAVIGLIDAVNRDPDAFESLTHARNYLLRAVRNQALKARHRRPMARAEFHEPSTEPSVEQLELRQQQLTRCLHELSTKDRELLRARFLERQTLAAISARTGVPISTLHTRERRLLEQLRRRIEHREKELS